MLFHFLLSSPDDNIDEKENKNSTLEEKKQINEEFTRLQRLKNEKFRLMALESAQKDRAFARPAPPKDVKRYEDKYQDWMVAETERMQKVLEGIEKKKAERAEAEAKQKEERRLKKKQDITDRLRAALDQSEVMEIRSKAASGSYEKKPLRRGMAIEGFLSDAFISQKVNSAGKFDKDEDPAYTLRAFIFDEICSGIEAAPLESRNFTCLTRCVEDYPQILNVITNGFPELLTKRKNILLVVLATVVQSTAIENKDTLITELQKLLQ
jgi:hypothetical protein